MVVDDVLWLFETWVVAGDDYLIALLYSLLCHQWALALVTVATGTANGDDFSALAFEHFVDGVQYVLQCIWCMGIVNMAVYLLALDWFQSSVYAVKGTHHYEYILWLLAEHMLHHIRRAGCSR